MNKLRQEAQALIAGTETIRPPVLRRSLREDYLFATNLPQNADENAAAEFRRRAERAGWRTEAENGWILMDPPPDKMDGIPCEGPFGPEARCCASLLKRHPEEKRRDGTGEKRTLLKAGEQGPDTYERACGRIHREWAAALRNGEGLPEIPEYYFSGGRDKC